MDILELSAFPLQSLDKLRYRDTDRQGHVNNSNFLTFLETGRVEFLYHPDFLAHCTGVNFVIASVKLDFMLEIKWPGQIEIGTGVIKIGNSSMHLYQQLFQNGKCVACAHTVIVQVDENDGKSKPFSEEAKAQLQSWLLS